MAMLSVGGGVEQPEVTEDVVRVWVEGSGRIREEVLESESRRGSVTVVDGDSWWTYDPDRGVLRHEGGEDHSVGTYDVASFLDPSVLIPHLDFGAIVSGEVDGRTCWMVDATPRRTLHEDWFPGLPLVVGGDSYRLWVDRERGTALRIEAFWGGQPFSIREATDVVFDADLNDELFEFDPPSDMEVFATSDQPDIRDVSIEEAARFAPFTVLRPTRLPQGSRIEVWFSAGGGFLAEEPSVSIRAWDEEDHRLVTILETAAGDAREDALDWRAEERDGTSYLIHDQGGERMVKVDLHGTRNRVMGPYEINVLLDIAASLEPASKDPPPLSG